MLRVFAAFRPGSRRPISACASPCVGSGRRGKSSFSRTASSSRQGSPGQRSSRIEQGGRSTPLPNGFVFMDDAAHRIFFSPRPDCRHHQAQSRATSTRITSASATIWFVPPKTDSTSQPGSSKELPAVRQEVGADHQVQGHVDRRDPDRGRAPSGLIMLTPRFMFIQSLNRRWDHVVSTRKEVGRRAPSRKLATDFYERTTQAVQGPDGRGKKEFIARPLPPAGRGILEAAQKRVDSLLMTSKNEEPQRSRLPRLRRRHRRRTRRSCSRNELEALGPGEASTRQVEEKLRRIRSARPLIKKRPPKKDADRRFVDIKKPLPGSTRRSSTRSTKLFKKHDDPRPDGRAATGSTASTTIDGGASTTTTLETPRHLRQLREPASPASRPGIEAGPDGPSRCWPSRSPAGTSATSPPEPDVQPRGRKMWKARGLLRSTT